MTVAAETAASALTLDDIPPSVLTRMVCVPDGRGWVSDLMLKQLPRFAKFARTGVLTDPLGWTPPRPALFYPVIQCEVEHTGFGIVKFGQALGVAWAEPKIGHVFNADGRSVGGSRLRVDFEDAVA